MKLLLIMPEFHTHTTFYSKAKWHFPFSIWYLGTYLKRKRHQVTLLDLNTPYRKLNDIDLKQFDAIGISCITAQVPRVRKLCEEIRTKTSAKILIGGIHPTLFPLQTANSPLVDIVFTGKIAPFKQCTPLDYTLLETQMLKQPKNFLGLVTSQGCPYQCTFCINSILDSNYEAWNAETVAFEVKRGLNMGFKGMFFWDDNFFAQRQRVEQFIDLVKKDNLKFEWFAFTRANNIDEKILKACYEIGLRRVSLGGESGSDKMLTYLKKGISVKDIECSAKVLNRNNIEASYSYMIGLPNETKRDIYATIDHLKRMGKILKYPKIVGPMLYCPYPGSLMYEECLKSGWKQPQTFEEWSDETNGNTTNPFKCNWIKDKEMVNIYWHYSFLIPLSLKKIRDLFRLWQSRTTNKLLGIILPLIYCMAIIGKLRHKYRFYRFPVEIPLLKPFKVVTGA